MRMLFKFMSVSIYFFVASILAYTFQYPHESFSTTITNLTASNGSLGLSLDDNSSMIDLKLSPSTRALLNNTSLDEQLASMGNLTSINSTDAIKVNDTQLSGTEKIRLTANFSSKPFGLDTDYSITDKPIVMVNNNTLTYEFVNDSSDEITISDILTSMRASVKLDNSTSSTAPVYIKVFSNPINVTENADGSKTYINNPSMVENIEIGGVIFSDASTNVKLYPNGTGTLTAMN